MENSKQGKMILTEKENAARIAEFDEYRNNIGRLIDGVAICKACGNTFPLAAGELAFYWRNDLFVPKRCPDCREIKKIEKSLKNNQDIELAAVAVIE